MRSRPSRAFALLCLALVAGGGACGASTIQAADTTGGGVVLTPSDAEGNEIAAPGYYELSVAPGSTTQVYAFVGNIQHKKVHVSIVPVDAGSGVYGGISYALPRERRKHVGAWLKLSSSGFSLAPHKARVVTVSISVPAHTAPGQYVGGLTAFVPATGKGSLIVQLRRILAVVVTVTGGPSVARFKIGSVRAKHRPDAYYLVTHIHNTGTELLTGQGHLWLWQTGHKKPVVSAALSVSTTVPQTTVHYPVFWSRHPARGRYTYKVTLSWSGGADTKTGVFAIT